MKKSLPVVIIILLIAIGGLVWQLNKNETQKLNLIRIEYPRPNQAIISPIVIKGQARGNWFFEASFPVILKDWDGKVIAQGIAQAKSDWMTTEFVPFEATLNFKLDKTYYGKSGLLILKKDNPSGLPENDDALEVPVKFGEVSEPMVTENVAGINQKILNNGVYITPTKVVSDSRCPSDVNCVWAGEILIKVKLEKGDEMKVVDLKEGESATIGGSKITFINALPVKRSTVTTKDSDYKFTFRIENNTAVRDYKDVTYIIEGDPAKINSGTTGGVTTRYFGNDLKADINSDGKNDIVFLVTQDSGGSGLFYYVVAAIGTDNGYIGSDGYFIGDRIAPQTIEISQKQGHKDVVVVNLADRAPNEPMVAKPSIGKSVFLKLDAESMQWGIVVPDFEGESR